jgi:hypothetical protein
MGKKNSKLSPGATANSDPVTISQPASGEATRRRPIRRLIQNFVLVWFDIKFDESNNNTKTTLGYLERSMPPSSIKTFGDIDKCVNYMNTIKMKRVFMIVSGPCDQQIIEKLNIFAQIESIYVLGDNTSVNEKWSKNIPKIKGVHSTIEPIYEALQIDAENHDRAEMPISVNGIDPLFMYTQLFKEALMEIEDDNEKSIKELVEYCQQQGISQNEIQSMENEYHDHSPIWWYTVPTFLYTALNCGL